MNTDENITMPETGSNNWLVRLNHALERSPVTPRMNNRQLAEVLGTSERDLFRKVKQLTGLSPQKYIRKYCLQQAMKFLETGQFRTVKETSIALGYSNVSYFIVQFEKEFGKKPFQVLKDQGWR